MNRKEHAVSLGITGQSFDGQRIRSVARIGSEKLFPVADVLANRLAHQEEELRAEMGRGRSADGGLNPIESAMRDRFEKAAAAGSGVRFWKKTKKAAHPASAAIRVTVRRRITRGRFCHAL